MTKHEMILKMQLVHPKICLFVGIYWKSLSGPNCRELKQNLASTIQTGKKSTEVIAGKLWVLIIKLADILHREVVEMNTKTNKPTNPKR